MSLPAAVAIIDQVLFEACPRTGYFLTPAFVIGKLYSNSMMVIFNSRVDFGPLLREEETISSTAHVGIGGYPARNAYHYPYEESLGDIDMDIRRHKTNSSLGHV